MRGMRCQRIVGRKAMHPIQDTSGTCQPSGFCSRIQKDDDERGGELRFGLWRGERVQEVESERDAEGFVCRLRLELDLINL